MRGKGFMTMDRQETSAKKVQSFLRHTKSGGGARGSLVKGKGDTVSGGFVVTLEVGN